MCGIVGIVSAEASSNLWQTRRDALVNLMYINALRGYDGTGYFGVPHSVERDIVLAKSAIPAYDFLQVQRFIQPFTVIEQFKYLVCHNRAATKGKLSYANTHPFVAGHIYLVHNGTLDNHGAIASGTYDVDSEALAAGIAEHGYKKTLEAARGPVATVWYDGKEDALYFYRNALRPLFYTTIKKTLAAKKDDLYPLIFFGSERQMLRLALERNNYSIGDMYEFKEQTVYRIEKDGFLPQEVDKISPPPQIVHTTYPRTVGASDYYDVVPTVLFSGPKPHLLTPNEADKHLAELQLKIGDTFSLQPDRFLCKKNKSKHGAVTGVKTFYGPHGMAVKTIDVVLLGIKRETLYRYPMISVEVVGYGTMNLPTYHLTDKGMLNVPVIFAKPNPSAAMNQLQQAPFDDDGDDTDTPDWQLGYKGPNGKEITLQKFNELVKFGCVLCQCDIFPIDHHILKWTNDAQPVCRDCQPKVFITPASKENLNA